MSSIEIEQKYRLKDPFVVRALLRHFKAKRVRSGKEFNEIWDRKGELGRRYLVLRLRHWGTDEALLTLKGPRQKFTYSKRMEKELRVSRKGAAGLLKALGYTVVKKYVKTREEYHVGKASVTIDFLPRFGWFLEIEGRSSEIRRWSGKLGLTAKDREERSYLAMLFGRYSPLSN